jgi:hypothetical protein
MRNLFILLCSFSISCSSLYAQHKEDASIKNLLEGQRISWNKGDVEGFMQGYWQSDSLMFIGKSGVTYGWQQTLDNYRKNYPDTAAMGKLDFEYVEIKRLSVNYFFVAGKWHLTRTIGDIGGSFTLLIRKINNKWVIVRDHSS